MSKIRYEIKPSSCVEGYYVHHCERNLLYSGIGKKEREKFGLNKPLVIGNPIAAIAGNAWEEYVIENYIDPEVLHKKTKITGKKISYQQYSPDMTVKEIKKMVSSVRTNQRTEYLYQGCFKATEDCRSEWFNFNKKIYAGKDTYLEVDFSNTYPDLIRADWSEADDNVVLSIVDIKLAQRIKLEHKVQVALYVRLLKGIIDDHNKNVQAKDKIEALINEKEGYLWNGAQENERPFPLSEIDFLLDDYFMNVIPKFVNKLHKGISSGQVSGIKDELERCVGPKCEWCENCHQCLGELKEKGSVQVIPHLTTYAQEFAREIGAPDTIKDLKRFVGSKNNRQLLSSNRSWEYILGDGTTLDVQLGAAPYDWDSIKNTGYKWKNKKSLSMPRWQDVMLILTAQKYAGDNRVYAFGIHVREYNRESDEDMITQNQDDHNIDIADDDDINKDVTSNDKSNRWTERYQIFIAGSNSDKDHYGNLEAFINALHEILTSYHDHNVQVHGADEKKSLQGYVLDQYELKNIEESMYEALESNMSIDIKGRAMEILFWMQGEKLIAHGTEQPKEEAEYPLIVINSELRKLVSLPLAVSYRLPEIISALNVWIDKDKLFKKDDHSKFFEYISNVMRSDTIYNVWFKGETSSITKIEKHLIKRLYAEGNILVKLQGEGRKGNHLVRSADVFSLPGRIDYNNELLKKWAFEVKIENLVAYHEIRSLRLQDLEMAMQSCDILKMKIIGWEEKTSRNGAYTNTYHTVSLEQNSGTENFKGGWFSAIMVLEDDLDEMYRFGDYKNSGWMVYTADNSRISVLNNTSFIKENDRLSVRGDVIQEVIGDADIGKNVYIAERYTDLNSKKIFSELYSLDQGNNGELLEPSTLCGKTGDDYENDKERLSSYSKMDGHDFTKSQEEAFKHLYENRFTVLQGPPGTGKSDFIARTVIALCRFYKKEKDTDLRVLISANSHAAIENVLFMIDKKTVGTDDIDLYKADRFDGDSKVDHIGKISVDKNISGALGRDIERPMVMGATNWASSKMNFGHFDLIIIDEASQVRVMDAMLALSTGNMSETRYLLVGDGDQLPAIIKGQYGKDTETEYLYGSVFDFYRKQINNNDLMLCENFRMNEILLRYSAEKIYSSRYKSFDQNIANRGLSYRSGSRSHGDIVDYILDGYSDQIEDRWPLVFCRISGRTPFEQSNAEVMLVSRLTEGIRQSVDYSPVDDTMFWEGRDDKDGVLGIVSPHHKHIERLKDRISNDTGMSRDSLYIGTVDKLQGQQREAVIVSYGVADLESAVTEGEFIFNRNRLNVALTRAKCKNITLFSEILTKTAPGMLDTEDEDLQRGIEFVCGFHSFMQRTETDTETDHRQFKLSEDDCKGIIVDVYRKRIKQEQNI